MTGERAIERRQAVKPPYGAAAGFVILTAQPDGSWRDDWDGEVHVSRDEAEAAFRDAASRLGAGSEDDYLMLCELINVEVAVERCNTAYGHAGPCGASDCWLAEEVGR